MVLALSGLTPYPSFLLAMGPKENNLLYKKHDKLQRWNLMLSSLLVDLGFIHNFVVMGKGFVHIYVGTKVLRFIHN
jgi:hypothetical protein